LVRLIRVLGLVVALGLVTGWAAEPAQLSPEEELFKAKAEAGLKRLTERFNDPSGDREKLAHDLRMFLVNFPGTVESVKAGELLGRLPSALDRLDPSKIPEIERFVWQPKELCAVVGEHRCRHGNPVSCVAFTSDGKWAASGGGGYVRIWDPQNMRLQSMVGHGQSVTSIAFNKDDTLLAAGTSYGYLFVWEVSDKGQLKLRGSVNASSGGVPSVAFHPKKNLVAVACGDNQTRVYDADDKQIKEWFTIISHPKAVTAVAFSLDGKWLADGSSDQTVKLWQVGEDKLIETAVLEGHPTGITALAFSPTNATLASAGSDGIIQFWTIPAGKGSKPRNACQVKDAAVTSLSFSVTGQTLAAGYSDSKARLWNMTVSPPKERGKPVEGHAGSVTGVAYGPGNKILLTGSADWTARTWDMTVTPIKDRYMPWSHLSVIYSAAFSPDNQTLATGSEDKVLRLWDMTRDVPRTRNYLKGIDAIQIYRVAYSPDGKMVAVGGNSTTVRQWDASSGKQLRPCASLPGTVSHLVYSPNSKQLLIGYRQTSKFSLYDPATGQEQRRCEGGETHAHCAAFTADGKQVLTGSGAHLYKDGKPVLVDGKHVFTDTVVRVWDSESGKELYQNKSFSLPIYGLASVPGTHDAFTGAYTEPMIHKWEVSASAMKEAEGIKGQAGYAYLIAASPDGKKLAVRGLDGSVVLYDIATGKQINAWGIPEVIANIAFSSDSRYLSFALYTGVAYVLRLEKPPGK
jgi:WD40 repeat protein